MSSSKGWLRRLKGFHSASILLTRFREAKEQRLSYPAASALRHTIAFDRPEGSFAVRAFGNVVHRYLQVGGRALGA